MLFILPVVSVGNHNKARENNEPSDNKKSENNSVQASYDPNNKDTSHIEQ